MLFTDQIFRNSCSQKTRPSICFKTCGRALQLVSRVFKILVQVFQKLDQAFEALGNSKKLGQVFMS